MRRKNGIIKERKGKSTVLRLTIFLLIISRNKLNVVNETPSVLSQTLYRLGILPFRWVSIEGNEIKTRDDFPRFFIV
jgi:hypothetical protein